MLFRVSGFSLLLVLLLTAACASPPAGAPAAGAPTLTGEPTAAASAPTTAVSTAAPVTALPETAAPPQGTATPPAVRGADFPFRVPLPPRANRMVSPNYRFGTDMDGAREVHHGVEFENPAGTEVLAAAAGTVVFAGVDDQAQLAPWALFYGNTVVLEHRLPGRDAPLYTLYAHLAEVLVHAGEQVEAGALLGRVGMSGSASGPHLHFEVRDGGNAYERSTNPELWLAPEGGRGSLTGRIAAPGGVLLPHLNITLVSLDAAEGSVYYLQTYAESSLSAAEWGENFALWNLPAGRYRVEFIAGGLHREEIVIRPGARTVFVYPLQD